METKMDPVIKDEWLNRLARGKYIHCKHNLIGESNKPGSIGAKANCCLGVLEEMYVEKYGSQLVEHVDDETGKRIMKLSTRSLAYLDEEEYLSSDVLNWAGISDNTQRLLADLNDRRGTINYIPAIIYIVNEL